jgi:hypothetical protein
MNPNKLNRDKLEQVQFYWKNHRSSILTKKRRRKEEKKKNLKPCVRVPEIKNPASFSQPPCA